MAFYNAIGTMINKRKTKIYLLRGINVFNLSEKVKIIKHANKVFKVNKSLLNYGEKYVLLIWEEKNMPMIDWWVWGEKESKSEGSLIGVYLFRNSKKYESPYVTAEDGLKILAGETGNLKK